MEELSVYETNEIGQETYKTNEADKKVESDEEEVVHLQFDKRVVKVEHQVIIATKGHRCVGRGVIAHRLAAALGFPILSEDDIPDEVPKPLSLQWILCSVASQVSAGLSVIVDSELSQEGEFDQLKGLANRSRVPILIVECVSGDASNLWKWLQRGDGPALWGPRPSSFEDLQQWLNNANTSYGIGDIPKYVVYANPGGDMEECLAGLAEFITGNSYRYMKCKIHYAVDPYEIGPNEEVSCNRCQKQVLGYYYQCKYCSTMFHETCTNLPREFNLSGSHIVLRDTTKMTGNTLSCDCCRNILRGYCYCVVEENIPDCYYLDLSCIFLPSICTVKLHEHPLALILDISSLGHGDYYRCYICGEQTYIQMGYACTSFCYFRAHPYCIAVPDTVAFERHRHPFKLSLSPPDEIDQYYCDICEKPRDPNHWIYNCEQCEYPVHVRCLLPATWPWERDI